MEDLDRKRRILSREEIELLDVERQMEYEISLQHQTVHLFHAVEPPPSSMHAVPFIFLSAQPAPALHRVAACG